MINFICYIYKIIVYNILFSVNRINFRVTNLNESEKREMDNKDDEWRLYVRRERFKCFSWFRCGFLNSRVGGVELHIPPSLAIVKVIAKFTLHVHHSDPRGRSLWSIVDFTRVCDSPMALIAFNYNKRYRDLAAIEIKWYLAKHFRVHW